MIFFPIQAFFECSFPVVYTIQIIRNGKNTFSRREALNAFTAAGGSVLLASRVAGAQEKQIQAAGVPAELTITLIGEHALRISLQQLMNGQPVPIAADGALVNEDWGVPALRIRSADSKNFQTGQFSIHISADPLTILVSNNQGGVTQRLQMDTHTAGVRFSLGSGPIFGLGQGGPQFDRRGSVDKMQSGQGGYHLGTHGAKVPVQFLIGSGWALFVHQPLGAFDLSGADGVLTPFDTDSGLPLDVFVIAARDPQQLLATYAAITGYPEMIPLWSLGYQQSHRTLGSPEGIIEEAKTFRRKRLPCDAMIYLGTGFCPDGWNKDNGEFTWNARMFPDSQKTIDELHSDNFKVVLHIVVEGEHFAGTVKDACTAAPLPPGRTADKHWPPDRQVSCYWPAHKPLFDQGIDGWWPDQGDGYDAPSRLARNRMYFEGSQLYRPNERVYALHRNAYAGMQRYGAFLWSGDVLSTWETLKVHVAVGINAGLSGIPYWGTDIGGFIPTEEYTGELFARWFQFAAFTPLFRSHGRDWRLHLPWGWTVGDIGYPETASYHPDAATLHNPAIEPICKRYLELRYQLMPYLYAAVKETCRTGLPIMRALWIHYPDDALAVTRGDEYLYGRDMLVAPVVQRGATSRSLYLPSGFWYDFWTQEKMSGGREISRTVDLETIPLYCRAGAIIPMGPVKQYTGEHSNDPITLCIYPGADGRFSLYEDDGHTFGFRRGEYMQIDMQWSDRHREFTLALANGQRMFGDPSRRFQVQMIGFPNKHEVLFSGQPVSLKM